MSDSVEIQETGNPPLDLLQEITARNVAAGLAIYELTSDPGDETDNHV